VLPPLQQKEDGYQPVGPHATTLPHQTGH
jgi:hypothetical protein